MARAVNHPGHRVTGVSLGKRKRLDRRADASHQGTRPHQRTSSHSGHPARHDIADRTTHHKRQHQVAAAAGVLLGVGCICIEPRGTCALVGGDALVLHGVPPRCGARSQHDEHGRQAQSGGGGLLQHHAADAPAGDCPGDHRGSHDDAHRRILHGQTCLGHAGARGGNGHHRLGHADDPAGKWNALEYAGGDAWAGAGAHHHLAIVIHHGDGPRCGSAHQQAIGKCHATKPQAR